MKLIIQPDDGLAPLLKAVRKAKKSIDIVIFRFDRPELEKALEAAVGRGAIPFDGRGSTSFDAPAIYGIGDSLVYFVGAEGSHQLHFRRATHARCRRS